MDALVTIKLIELAIAGIQGAFTLFDMAGKTPAEIDAIYEQEKAKFLVNKPETLPDV